MTYLFELYRTFEVTHPSVILKNFDSDLFVVPISSKKPHKYIKLEQDLQNKNISKKENKERINAITEIIELSKINDFINMLRWDRITRMKKINVKVLESNK